MGGRMSRHKSLPFHCVSTDLSPFLEIPNTGQTPPQKSVFAFTHPATPPLECNNVPAHSPPSPQTARNHPPAPHIVVVDDVDQRHHTGQRTPHRGQHHHGADVGRAGQHCD